VDELHDLALELIAKPNGQWLQVFEKRGYYLPVTPPSELFEKTVFYPSELFCFLGRVVFHTLWKTEAVYHL
ncbi:MAG TPA: hypothetical protein VJV40_09600, partial [Thermodesulfobacteriota bacterium]|nr:hypothetical protein [Thermodesulfobacteriota bacterium]